MRTTIDRAGRVVIPKELRTELGLSSADEVDVVLRDDHIELSPAPRQVRLTKRPDGLLTSDIEIAGHGPDEVRSSLERARR